jgi:hypothetical protein
MRASVVPGFGELAELVLYVASNPHLFVSSSTVMTTGVLLATLALRLTALRSALAARLLALAAPPLALLCAYFGAGAMALATVLFLRLRDALPLETEIQLVSGLGHLAVALLGIALVAPALRARGAGAWLAANALAVGYWAAQLAIVRPPWFDFQEQGQLTRGLAVAVLAASALATAAAALRHRRRAAADYQTFARLP